MHKFVLLLKIIVPCFLAGINLYGAENSAPAGVDQLLLERARNGEAQARLEAGFAFYRNNNPVRAAYWFGLAAQQGLAEAQYNIGCCYLAGYGVEKNLHTALKFFQQAAAQELPPAQLEYAKLLLTGIAAVPDAAPPRKAVEPDEKTAAALLEKLLNKRYKASYLVYANHLINKHRQDKPEKIIALLEMAITAGEKKAPVILADFLLNRHDKFRDEKRAKLLLENSAPGDPEAMAKLAFIIENGFGAPPEPAKAFELYKKALQKTFVPMAAARLANYYYAGCYGVKQDVVRAIELYTGAAAAGVPEALTKLGICHKNGIGVKVDKEQAFELFFQAAKQDYPPAQYELGKCFAEGSGTIADLQGAFYWFNQSAMRYEPRGLLEAGRCLLHGKGTMPDAEKAAAYLEQAYANGMNEALPLLQEARKQQQIKPAVKPQKLPVFGL